MVLGTRMAAAVRVRMVLGTRMAAAVRTVLGTSSALLYHLNPLSLQHSSKLCRLPCDPWWLDLAAAGGSTNAAGGSTNAAGSASTLALRNTLLNMVVTLEPVASTLALQNTLLNMVATLEPVAPPPARAHRLPAPAHHPPTPNPTPDPNPDLPSHLLGALPAGTTAAPILTIPAARTIVLARAVITLTLTRTLSWQYHVRSGMPLNEVSS